MPGGARRCQRRHQRCSASRPGRTSRASSAGTTPFARIRHFGRRIIRARCLRSDFRICALACEGYGTERTIKHATLLPADRRRREKEHQIGLSPSFTIHDREDSADLLNLVRHDLGFSKTEKRFPAKSTCLAIYSRVVNAESPAEEVLGSAFPWCVTWEPELRRLFAAYVEAKQHQDASDYLCFICVHLWLNQ